MLPTVGSTARARGVGWSVALVSAAAVLGNGVRLRRRLTALPVLHDDASPEGGADLSEHVVVHGRLRVRQWKTAEKSGLAIEIEADSVGHDLAWGTSSYTKSSASRASASTDEPEYGESTNVGGASDVWATPGTGWGVTEPGSDDVAVLDSGDQPADDEVVEHVPA